MILRCVRTDAFRDFFWEELLLRVMW